MEVGKRENLICNWMRYKVVMTTFNRGSNSLHGAMIWVNISVMGKYRHEYLKHTETSKCKVDFLLGYNQGTSTFWFSIHETILSLKQKTDSIIWQPVSLTESVYWLLLNLLTLGVYAKNIYILVSLSEDTALKLADCFYQFSLLALSGKADNSFLKW